MAKGKDPTSMSGHIRNAFEEYGLDYPLKRIIEILDSKGIQVKYPLVSNVKANMLNEREKAIKRIPNEPTLNLLKRIKVLTDEFGFDLIRKSLDELEALVK